MSNLQKKIQEKVLNPIFFSRRNEVDQQNVIQPSDIKDVDTPDLFPDGKEESPSFLFLSLSLFFSLSLPLSRRVQSFDYLSPPLLHNGLDTPDLLYGSRSNMIMFILTRQHLLMVFFVSEKMNTYFPAWSFSILRSLCFSIRIFLTKT